MKAKLSSLNNIVKSDLKMQHFRCYAFKINEYWYAACIDLNLVDRSETLDTVVSKLRKNIQL